jgi:hypothetical protein
METIMEWTRERPTVAGYYWYRDEYAPSDIVNILPMTLRFWEMDEEEDMIKWRRIHPGEWYGPLTVPD